jgi:hypothetical protein
MYFVLGVRNEVKTSDKTEPEVVELLDLTVDSSIVFAVGTVKRALVGAKPYLGGKPRVRALHSGMHEMYDTEIRGYDKLLIVDEKVLAERYKSVVSKSLDDYYNDGVTIYELRSMVNFNLSPFLPNEFKPLEYTGKGGWFAFDEDSLYINTGHQVETLAFTNKKDAILQKSCDVCDPRKVIRSTRLSSGSYSYRPKSCDGVYEDELYIVSYDIAVEQYRTLIRDSIYQYEDIYTSENEPIINLVALLNFDIEPFE